MSSNHTAIIGAWVSCKLAGRNTLLYCTLQTNHHAGTPKHNNYKRHDKLAYSSVCYIVSRIGWVSNEGSLQVIDRGDTEN